jgi:hypothetical protein
MAVMSVIPRGKVRVNGRQRHTEGMRADGDDFGTRLFCFTGGKHLHSSVVKVIHEMFVEFY